MQHIGRNENIVVRNRDPRPNSVAAASLGIATGDVSSAGMNEVVGCSDHAIDHQHRSIEGGREKSGNPSIASGSASQRQYLLCRQELEAALRELA